MGIGRLGFIRRKPVIRYTQLNSGQTWFNGGVKVRRHSKKHIIKLYNKLKNGEVCTHDRTWFAEGDHFGRRHILSHGTIIIKSIDWTDCGAMFEYEDIQEFIDLFRNVEDLCSPTWYIKVLNGTTD